MRVLVVEDDLPSARFVCKGLREHGFVVDHSPHGKDDLLKALDMTYDTLIVDRMRTPEQ